MNAVFFNEYIQTSPRFMTDFTPWTLFVDTGIISVLLLLGKLMRVKIRFIQRLFIPPSLLAGFIGLSLGPHGFGIIPLSTQTGTYAGILIAFIFGALPLISQKAAKGDADNIGSMWAYSHIIRKSKFPQNPKRSVRFSGKGTKRSVQKRKARNTQKAETKVL